MESKTLGLMLVIIVYLIMMVVVGVIYSRKNKDVRDFYLGGRKLGPIVTAMSAEASDMSSWLLMGLPGLAYISGLAEASWTAIGLAIGTYLNWLFVAKRLRVYSAHNNSITVPDFLKNRYHDNGKVLVSTAALIIIVFFIPYTASGFAACGKLFSTLFGVPYLPAMIVSAIVIVAYTTMGGFLAASTTDLIQSIVMTLALVIVIIFGIKTAGGFDQVVDNARELEGYLSLTETHLADGGSEAYTGLTIASILAWGLGYFGMPHILLRFMGIEDEKKLKTSRRIASIWVVIAMGVAIFIGVIGYSMSKAGVIELFTNTSDSETLMVRVSMILSENGTLLLIMGGLILAGILACTMSTSDSQLLAAASSLSENIVKDAMGIKLNNKQSMIAARLTVIGIAVLGVLLAINPDSSVFRIVSFAWAGFGATFGPAMLLALFWKNSTKEGCIAGMIAGGVMIFLWKFVIANLGGVFAIYELLPAFIIGAIVNIAVSKKVGAPSAEIIAEFEEVKAM
ncbi:MAG: sodium/proline symporter [Clostridia bacterium]|nr:sodium/proline symporter [Clostridia bacterium]